MSFSLSRPPDAAWLEVTDVGQVLAGLEDRVLLACLFARRCHTAGDVADALLRRFGSLAAVAGADVSELGRTPGVNLELIGDISLVREFAVRLARTEASARPAIASWTALTAYVRTTLSGYPREHFRVLFLDNRNNDIIETYGAHNTILDNCFVYTAFSALDPITQDKVSRLTGTVLEKRTSRSGPGLMGSGRSTVSHSETERPLLEPGEIRALADDQQLVFVAGQKPVRMRKLQYDRREPFRSRATMKAPSQRSRVDAPPVGPHPWAGRRALGEDPDATLPLFKEVSAAMDDKKVAAKAVEIFGKVSQEMAAQEAALDQLRGLSDAKD